jgi:hypothetical protein
MDPLMTFLTWLEATPLAGMMRQSPWSYPLVETAHILGFILLIGAAAMFDLRLLGLTPRLPVVDVARHLLPWSHVGPAVVVISGVLLFAADPVALWFNTVFRAKMVLIVFAGLNAAAFHAWPFRSVANWNQFAPIPWSARVAASLSLALWITIAALGRLIAYIE